MAVEPPPCRWELPHATTADDDGIVGAGADLEPGTILAAYRRGLFPMPLAELDTVAWWSPDPRGIIELADFRISRSLRQSARRYRTTINRAFPQVVDSCRRLPRPGGWINDDIRNAYVRLHRLGWAHSVETWSDGRLVGGLYGIGIGGLFAGESMFHLARDASKVALARLVEVLAEGDHVRLLDTQWSTDHLRSLGASDVSRTTYLERLPGALAAPTPAAFETGPPSGPTATQGSRRNTKPGGSLSDG